MLRKSLAFSSLTAMLLLSGCSLGKKAPFVASAVPADFAIVVDENHDTYYARQHVQQVITANDSMSRTTYTTYRDYNNTVSNKFTQETPLSSVQLQTLWNDIASRDILTSSHLWVSWLSDSDLYKRDAFIIQLRANGMSRTYKQTNGFSGPVRPIMLQLEALRLPFTQDAKTRVVGETEAATMPAQPVAETQPTAGTQPAAPSQPVIPAMAPAETQPAPAASMPAK